MVLLVLLLVVTSCFMCGECADIGNKTDSLKNLTDFGKDMYVIHATVYQVGILTNSTDNMTDNLNSTGNQESVTLYHTNGTNVDLSSIPEPFLTNVTAQTLVGVAPIPDNGKNGVGNAWGALKQLTHPSVSTDEKLKERTKKSMDNYSGILRLFKRDTTDTPVKVVSGAALIPSEVEIHSISLPPLMSLNYNLTEFPVPIPNTSVVQYAKVNTLIQKP